MDITILSTGVANVASVRAAFTRLGARVAISSDPNTCAMAEALVLPGVGSFAAGMGSLASAGIADSLRNRVDRGRPTLAICLGMQLLTESSDESPAAPGLGILPARAERLEGAPRLPHFGWNRVDAPDGAAVIQSGAAYFAHTYCVRPTQQLEDEGWVPCLSREGTPFVSAVERGAVVATQFHPELSGTYGQRLLQRWLRLAGPSASPTQEPATGEIACR